LSVLKNGKNKTAGLKEAGLGGFYVKVLKINEKWLPLHDFLLTAATLKEIKRFTFLRRRTDRVVCANEGLQ
jgi:hypothetical protein